MKVLSQHIAILLSFGCLLFTGCLKENIFEENPAEGGLMLHPSVVSLATKTVAADDNRDENNLGSYLDVFIKGNDTDNAGFWKEYHLTNRTFTSENGELLHVNWPAEGYQVGKKYNVYVVVNGPDAVHDNVGSFSALQALTHSDSDIFRLKYYTGDQGTVDNNSYAYTSSKAFLMDGLVENWTPQAGKKTQIIEADNMARAAAKIVVNVNFDQAFLDELMANGEIPQDPSFRYVNFATCSSVLRSETAGDPALATGRWLSLNSVSRDVEADSSTPEYSYSASLTTYSYAYSWDSSNPSQGLGAPYVMISVLYQVGDAREYHYYRIPVRPAGATSLERNHIYTVTATIDNRGSYKVVDAMEPANLEYQVLEWTEENSEVTHIAAKKSHYFMVTPLTQVLRGEGIQTAVLKYYAPEGASITIENIPSSQLTADDATKPTFDKKALYLDLNGNAQDTESTVVITKDETKQTITVSSTALANRASTFIRFRATYAYVDEGTPKTITQDIYIRHFPLDNISNIAGWYSYKNDGDFIEYSFNPEADGWDSYDGYEDNIICPNEATYDGAAVPQGLTTVSKGTEYSWQSDDTEIERSEYVAAIKNTIGTTLLNSTFKRRTGSRDAAVQGEGGYSSYWYYGTGQVTVRENAGWFQRPDPDTYDWAVVGFLNNDFYRHLQYFKFRYVQGRARRYYRHLPTSWVRWEFDSQAHGYLTSKTVYDNVMRAKVYDNGQIYNIKQTQTGSNYIAEEDDTISGSNNHMYIIELSSTSDTYVLGKPIIEDNQSSDDVVSPAFMLASQLSSMEVAQPMSFNTAKAHCGTYVEVGVDGYVYENWRLPTQKEIEMISNYQKSGSAARNSTLDVILTGRYYWALNGESPLVNSSDSREYYWARCVRDLTPEELELLNKVK